MKTTYTRDASKILPCLKELPDGSLLTTKAIKIVIPSRFAERNLAEVGSDIFIPGIYAIMTPEGSYAVSTVCARIRITPSKIMKQMMFGVEYYEFHFEPGQIVIPDLNVVKQDTFIYYVFDEIITKANIPWYLNYNDLSCIFDSCAEYAGTKIADNYELTELIVAFIARSDKDRTKGYRTITKGYTDLVGNPPAYVPLSNVIYSATSTSNRLAGSYMSDGIVGSLVTPTTRVDRVESFLRA